MPRYWALIILSIVYRLGGVVLLILTILSTFAFVSVADDSDQIIIPTFPPLPTFPPFPDFSFNPQEQPILPFPDINTNQVTAQISQTLGAFAGVFVLVWGLLASVGLFALGQFLVLMIDVEYNMRVTAHGLETRAARRG